MKLWKVQISANAGPDTSIRIIRIARIESLAEAVAKAINYIEDSQPADEMPTHYFVECDIADDDPPF